MGKGLEKVEQPQFNMAEYISRYSVFIHCLASIQARFQDNKKLSRPVVTCEFAHLWIGGLAGQSHLQIPLWFAAWWFVLKANQATASLPGSSLWFIRQAAAAADERRAGRCWQANTQDNRLISLSMSQFPCDPDSTCRYSSPSGISPL